MIDVEVLGIDEVNARLEAMTKTLGTAEVSRVYLAAARAVRDAAKAEAPVSRWPKKDGAGRLRESIVALSGRRWAETLGPAAVARVNVKKGRGARAPHAHLAEFGTEGVRRPKKAGRMRFAAPGGGWLAPKTVGRMPANRFWQRAVERSGSAALEMAARETLRIIQRAADGA